ncbi:MAG: tRNA (adenosine(37)-N6)-threonylcarbamoyltransferase complex ATPase subunit type 1 TsaE [Bacteroidota bacterium]
MQTTVSVSVSVEETQALAKEFARQLSPGDVVCLEGDLGAGKTHFAKGVASFFGVQPDRVSSPTFTIIHEYAGTLPIYHFDCYRLEKESEALEIGAEEYFYSNGICLVEWPDRIPGLIPEQAIRVLIEHVATNKRSISIHP